MLQYLKYYQPERFNQFLQSETKTDAQMMFRYRAAQEHFTHHPKDGVMIPPGIYRIVKYEDDIRFAKRDFRDFSVYQGFQDQKQTTLMGKFSWYRTLNVLHLETHSLPMSWGLLSRSEVSECFFAFLP